MNFLRHHDEINLLRLTRQQRNKIFDAFAPEPRMQIYERGIRRRLAPLAEDLRMRMNGHGYRWIRVGGIY